MLPRIITSLVNTTQSEVISVSVFLCKFVRGFNNPACKCSRDSYNPACNRPPALCALCGTANSMRMENLRKVAMMRLD
jgi:hypothetical protein